MLLLLYLLLAFAIGYEVAMFVVIRRIHRSSKTWPQEVRDFFKSRRLRVVL